MEESSSRTNARVAGRLDGVGALGITIGASVLGLPFLAYYCFFPIAQFTFGAIFLRTVAYIVCTIVGMWLVWWGVRRSDSGWKRLWKGLTADSPDGLKSFDVVLFSMLAGALVVLVAETWSTARAWKITDDLDSLQWVARLAPITAIVPLLLYWPIHGLGRVLRGRLVKPPANFRKGNRRIKKHELSREGVVVCFGLAGISGLMLTLVIALTGGLISPLLFLLPTFVSITALITDRSLYPITVMVLCVELALSMLHDPHPDLRGWVGFSYLHLMTFIVSVCVVVFADMYRNR